MPTVTSGVFPVHMIQFKVGTAGRTSDPEDMATIKDMETFQIAIDTNVEEWTPMDTEGWIRRLATGKGFSITLNGKRHVGDPGNDYVANLAWASGLDCSSVCEVEFPDGSTLEFDCVVSVTASNGGDSTGISALEVELMSDGRPTYSEVPSYMVTYHPNGGTGIGPASFKQSESTTFTAAAAHVFTPPSDETFDEWNTAANGMGTGYAAGATVTMPGSNLTLYAIWTSI